MLPTTAESILVVEQTQFLNYVVHYQVCVDLWFVSHVLFVSLTKLANLIDVEALIRIYFQHSVHQASQFLTIAFRWLREIPLTDSLEQLI